MEHSVVFVTEEHRVYSKINKYNARLYYCLYRANMKQGELNARFNDNISCEITFISLGLIVLECLQKVSV
jgi:hypothetical protein